MNAIAQLSARDRRDLFTEAAARTGLPPFHLEKDFWVCWTLGVLFQHPETKSHLTFRGGTSLSKAWQIIERFSEDIDLSISRQWF
jgi:predicted nucleotidyltransferase component of viral defense system